MTKPCEFCGRDWHVCDAWRTWCRVCEKWHHSCVACLNEIPDGVAGEDWVQRIRGLATQCFESGFCPVPWFVARRIEQSCEI